MKRYLGVIVALMIAAQPALANQCPTDMAAIDAAIAASPAIAPADLERAKTLRAKGETFHAAGNHAESMAALAEAKTLLGIM